MSTMWLLAYERTYGRWWGTADLCLCYPPKRCGLFRAKWTCERPIWDGQALQSRLANLSQLTARTFPARHFLSWVAASPGFLFSSFYFAFLPGGPEFKPWRSPRAQANSSHHRKNSMLAVSQTNNYYIFHSIFECLNVVFCFMRFCSGCKFQPYTKYLLLFYNN